MTIKRSWASRGEWFGW